MSDQNVIMGSPFMSPITKSLKVKNKKLLLQVAVNSVKSICQRSNMVQQPTPERFAHIKDFIYLGSKQPPPTALTHPDYETAKNIERLRSAGVTHVINCSPMNCSNLYEEELTYLNINIADNWETDLFIVIYLILEFISNALAKGNRVMVHCWQVSSRPKFS